MGRHYKGLFACATDIGKIRISNEDRANVLTNFVGDVFLIICDGMGGQNKGDYASKVACDLLSESFKRKRTTPLILTRLWLRRVLKEANSLIFEEASKNKAYEGMGTTCVAVYIQGEKMIVANIGDSRAYKYGYGRLERLTEDQTYVDYLYRTGKIDAQEKETSPERHILMNALGVYPSLAPDISIHPYHGEAILCCSDGLYNNVSEAEIRAVLSTDERPDMKVASLIAEANGNGGSDNIGISYWEVIDHD